MISTAILRDEPASISSSRAGVPADLARIITRCLAKDPRARFQTALDVANELAGIVVEHPMDPGLVSRIEALKVSIPKSTLDGLVANASALSPAAVLAMVGG